MATHEKPHDAQPSTREAYGVLLRVAYDGGRYSGFVLQDNASTVAQALLGAIRSIDPQASALRAVSRTDAGVHARDQVVCFDTEKAISSRGWVLGLNQNLERSVAVVSAERVAPGFDPRHHATRKGYRYTLLEQPVPNPLWNGRAWRVHERLNHRSMSSALATLLGTHDFGAFRSSKDVRTNTVRTVFRAALAASHDETNITHVDIEGDRFMHRMVRIIVGTLVDIGRGRLPLDAFERAFVSRDRRGLGMTAPPDGLCLTHIELDVSGRDKWPNHASEH